MLEEPEIGKFVALDYGRDRGEFATNAVAEIVSTLVKKSSVVSFLKEDVEKLIDKLYRICFPMNRGALLYFLARHLKQFDYISSRVRQKLTRSHAVFVSYWEKAILEELDGKSAK